MPLAEDQALSDPTYWDARYSNSLGHEWFRDFEELKPFFERNLLSVPGFTPDDDPAILHLGSGDS
ncbi:hypothetical protein QBC42DRAFT_285216, partial [Cladorrhinum samala]